MSTITMVAVIGVGTLLLRASLVALLARAEIPDRIEQALRLVAPAIMAGLVTQSLLVQDGAIVVRPSWDVAAVVAVLVAWRTRSLTWTLVIGMVSLWLVEAVL